MYSTVQLWTEVNDDTTPQPPGKYWHESVLRGAAEMLRESAKQHRLRGDIGHAQMCESHAAELEE